jgi:hypothetical protein
MLVTFPTFQLDMFPLNTEQPRNISDMLITFPTFQLDMFPVNAEHSLNIPNISVTLVVLKVNKSVFRLLHLKNIKLQLLGSVNVPV